MKAVRLAKNVLQNSEKWQDGDDSGWSTSDEESDNAFSEELVDNMLMAFVRE